MTSKVFTVVLPSQRKDKPLALNRGPLTTAERVVGDNQAARDAEVCRDLSKGSLIPELMHERSRPLGVGVIQVCGGQSCSKEE